MGMDEKLKKQTLVAFIGFNLTFIIYQFFFNYSFAGSTEFNLMSWLIAFGVGVVGGIVGFVAGKFLG
tara:strand:- start:294 stop:494 length:201 start_codon:yes stop_codon:yes gene_type:complete